MVETVVGLSLLMIILSIFALFLMPLMVRGPDLSASLRTTLELEQLQAQCLAIARDLSLPPWWPDSCLECSATQLRIHDLGYRYTTREEARPDLLELSIDDQGLSLAWKGQRFRYRHIIGASLSLAGPEGQKPVAAILSVPTKTEALLITFPLRSMKVLHAE
jgi:hypothetical protein